jgi:acetoacetate decarboxylase
MIKNLAKSCIFIFLIFFISLEALGGEQETNLVYSMPRISPLYPPPPLQFRDNRILTIIFRSTPRTLEKLVPKPLVPNPLNLMFIYIAQLNIQVSETERYPYLEAGIGVPASFSQTLGNYAVYLYLDKTLPIVGGREIWGWPKKDASISFVEKDGKISANLERLGFPLISVNASLEKKIEPFPESPRMPWYNLKIIPSVERAAPPEVLQLTSTVNSDTKIKEHYICKAGLEFKASPWDPLADIDVLEITDVTFQVSDFVMNFGKVIYDYLDEKNRE